MVEVLEGGEAVGDDLMGALPLQVDDEANAAAVVLVPRVIEALGAGLSGVHHVLQSSRDSQTVPTEGMRGANAVPGSGGSRDCETIPKVRGAAW